MTFRPQEIEPIRLKKLNELLGRVVTLEEGGGGGGGGASEWGDIGGDMADQTDLAAALAGKSPTGHDHSGVYSEVGHNHSGVYALVAHDHDGVYATAAHDHSGVYSPVGHDHSGVYSPVGHSHDTFAGNIAVADNIILDGGPVLTWTYGKAVHGQSSSLFLGRSGDAHFNTVGYGGGSWTYGVTGFKAASMYLYEGNAVFRSAAAGTAGNPLTWTETWTLKGIADGGHILALSDNVYDIGASGSNRPRYGHFGTGVTVGGVAVSLAGHTHSYAAVSHTHSASEVTDFSEAVDDRVGALLSGVGGIDVTYDDGAGTIEIDGSGISGGGADPPTLGTFTPVTGAVPETLVESDAITVTGTAGMVWPVTARGEEATELEVNGDGVWAPTSCVMDGDTVKIRTMTSPSTFVERTATLFAPGASSDFTVETAEPFATGGTVSTIPGYIVHTFTSGGTITFSDSGTVDILLVAGGGGGGQGGGGGGGVIYQTSVAVTAGANSITVGAGGAYNAGAFSAGSQGGNSTGLGYTAVGGGGGGGADTNGGNGGSGGGAGPNSGGVTVGGAFTSGQGNGGGGRSGNVGSPYVSGGGGGAGAVGGDAASSTISGSGGAGVSNSINGTATTYAGGGGGASYIGSATAGTGGAGGGGNGNDNGNGANGTANTGGGGGGGYSSAHGGVGGSGIVIIRYAV